MKTKKIIQEKKKYKEFRAKHLKPFVEIIPFFILKGIKNPIEDYDSLALAESFFDNEKGVVLNELWNCVEYLSNKKHDTDIVMQMLYGGWEYFDEYEVHSKIFSSEKLQKIRTTNNLSILHAAKCLIAGIDHANWYEDTYRTFVELLPGYDIELFVKAFGATSPMSHFRSNLVFALQAYDCIKQGRSVEKLSLIPPAKAMLRDLQKGKFDTVAKGSTRRKVINFTNAILGDKSAVIVDSWMLKAYNAGREYEWNGKLYCRHPFVSMYDFIEHHIQTLGKGTGYEARQITAMIWAGIRIIHSKFKEADTRTVLSKILST